jgi:hypothetical protein
MTKRSNARSCNSYDRENNRMEQDDSTTRSRFGQNLNGGAGHPRIAAPEAA